MSRVLPRVLHVALAEGRGHLVRAQRLGRVLAPHGIEHRIVTTNAEGQRFLASLGVHASLLPGGLRLPYDAAHRLVRAGLAQGLARYVLSGGLLADHRAIEAHDADLVLVDSFHPAAMWGRLDRTVFVHGDTMEDAVLDELRGLAAPLADHVERTLAQSRAVIHHGFAVTSRRRCIALPPLLEPVRGSVPEPSRPLACVYLNPHFRDPAIAAAIEQALAGFQTHLVGEGYVDRSGWRASDPELHESIARATVWISGGGMAAIAEALRFGAHFVALEGDQPEQARNLDRAHALLGRRMSRLAVSRGELGPALARALSAIGPRASGAAVDPGADAWRATVVRLLRPAPAPAFASSFVPPRPLGATT